MKVIYSIPLVVLTAVAAGILPGATGTAADSVRDPALDPLKPEAWEASVLQTQGALQHTVADLMTIVKNEKLPEETRRKGVALWEESRRPRH